jgi:hypothetical protein
MPNPGDDHWKEPKRVCRYLGGTSDYGIHYSGYPPVLEGYSGSNWISDAEEIKATSGYIFTLVGAAVAWRSCKQTVLTKTMAKVDLVALETATNEAEWLRELLMDLPLLEKQVPPILVHCDNQTMLAHVMNTKDNSKSNKHIKRRLKTIRKMRNSRVIAVSYVRTENMADPFTMGLSWNVIFVMSKDMGMRPI